MEPKAKEKMVYAYQFNIMPLTCPICSIHVTSCNKLSKATTEVFIPLPGPTITSERLITSEKVMEAGSSLPSPINTLQVHQFLKWPDTIEHLSPIYKKLPSITFVTQKFFVHQTPDHLMPSKIDSQPLLC